MNFGEAHQKLTPVTPDKLYRLHLRSWLTTVRARLYLAFGAAAAMTVVSSLVGLYAFTTTGATTTEIVTKSLPATEQSLRLAEETQNLVASAPALMNAENESDRAKIAAQIARQVSDLSTQIERLRVLNDDKQTELITAQGALVDRLSELDRAVDDRLAMSRQRNAMLGQIRGLCEEFFQVLVPAIDDANFELATKTSGTGDQKLFNESLESLRYLLEIQAESNLLTGLTTEASLVGDIARLQPLREQIDASRAKIKRNLEALANIDLKQRLLNIYDKFTASSGQGGIIVLRERELQKQREAQTKFAAAQAEAVKLKRVVDDLVEMQDQSARKMSKLATTQIRSGQLILIGLSVVALIAASLIAWLYVGRNIVHRLGILIGAMRRMAAGDLSVTILEGGEDEIAEMARTLLVFRKASADAAAARQTEQGHARELEIRRQKVEIATRNFELAVAEIIAALDHASKSMDQSAQAMTEEANRNQSEALTAASAAEETTANVENVARGVDEIAQSVLHISEQVVGSASVARQAAQEAKVITTTVEGLSASVSQVGDISTLIRKIASQTNLLALNATIEAARAGEAGRGFAIVAQEVKSLAGQTEKATENITGQILAIESTTSNAANAMKTIVATITRLDEIANAVATTIEQQGSVVKEISHAAGGAADGTRHLSSSINQVSQSATETGQVATIVLNAARELSARSNTLRTEVERFLTQVRAA